MGIYAYSQSIHKYLPLPRRSHVADGLLQRQVQIDDFDADCFDDIVVTTRALDPRKLTPTQETVDTDNFDNLCRVDIADLPPIKVVQVGAELRILDGHHRACRAAVRGEPVLAQVLELI